MRSAWAGEVEERGAGEILPYQHGDRRDEGGIRYPHHRGGLGAVGIPVVASGGVGTLEHFYDGFAKGKADACLAASVFPLW